LTLLMLQASQRTSLPASHRASPQARAATATPPVPSVLEIRRVHPPVPIIRRNMARQKAITQLGQHTTAGAKIIVRRLRKLARGRKAKQSWRKNSQPGNTGLEVSRGGIVLGGLGKSRTRYLLDLYSYYCSHSDVPLGVSDPLPLCT
jgi:hypothetical protein